MLSILVCHSYFSRLDQKQYERGKPYPPLATLQAAALLRAAGHEISFFDAMLAEGPEEYEQRLRSVHPQVVLLYEDTFNFLSKMCLSTMRQAACAMIAAARRQGARVIVAGPDVSDAPEPYLAAGAEVTLAGEGLAALLALVPRLDRRPDIEAADLVTGIAGVSWRAAGRIARNRGASVLPSGRFEGFAAWDLVDMEHYRRIWRDKHGHFSLNLAASRGCSFRCSWCAKPTWGNLYLQRSPEEVGREALHLKRAFAADHLWFADDIFGFRVEWVRTFGAAMRASGETIPFTIQTRADLVSVSMADALAEAGCREAWIGAESGSQRILDAMHKGTTLAEIHEARRRLAAAGIRVGFFIQLGFLGEQLEDLLATRALIESARPDEIGVSVSYPLPGTRFHELVKAQLGAKTHWRESDDLEMMFRGTYTSDFYRTVRDLLHDQVTLQTAQCAPDSLESGVAARAARTLERRWRRLWATEAAYRSAPARASAS